MLQNYKAKFEHGGRFIFVPNEECVRKGKRIVNFCRDRLEFPECFFHYRKGGHVAALHRHLDNRFFFRIDIQNLYYVISRNRACRVLHNVGFGRARTYGKWSSVQNPLAGPRYALPIGFVQSPALASLVMMHSPVMTAIGKAQEENVFLSVYLDDLIGSSLDIAVLENSYRDIVAACIKSNLPPNPGKLLSPAPEIIAFNCRLRHGLAEVTEDRVSRFFAKLPGRPAEDAFASYCTRVADQNLIS